MWSKWQWQKLRFLTMLSVCLMEASESNWCSTLMLCSIEKEEEKATLWGIGGFLILPYLSRKRCFWRKQNHRLALMQVPVDGATDTAISLLLKVNFCLLCEREQTPSAVASFTVIGPRLFLIIFHLFRNTQPYCSSPWRNLLCFVRE